VYKNQEQACFVVFGHWHIGYSSHNQRDLRSHEKSSLAKAMKSSKKIFFSIIILIIIGVAIVYAVYRNSKSGFDPPDTKRSTTSDSAKNRNREAPPAEMDVKPQVDSKDGSVKMVKEFIKLHAKNPSTFEFLEWSEVSSEDGFWKVRCKYRGVSSFNAEVTTNAWFYIQNNKVVYTKIISKV
jgi:hypothetical protein